jgi:3-isopropylmalate/(R)-2-methylmalate dehydratase small subunit
VKKKISGKVWKFGSNIDTDQIIPAEYLVTGDPQVLALHAFEKLRPEFSTKVVKGDIIVADENFGSGSSREHAPRALIGAGIACVVAKSFARIFFRNSINIGLPMVISYIEAADGDTIGIDFEAGRIENQTSKVKYSFSPMPSFLQKLINSGGLVKYTESKL